MMNVTLSDSVNVQSYLQLPMLVAWVVVFWLTEGCLSAQTIAQDTLTVSFTPRDSLLIKQVTCKRTSYIDLDENVNFSYRRFKGKLTIDQLTKLTNHADACVRAYAFSALVEREYGDIEKVLVKHLNDSLYIPYPIIGGDVIGRILLIKFMIGKAPLDEATLKRYYSQVSKRLYKVDLVEIVIDPEDLEEDTIR